MSRYKVGFNTQPTFAQDMNPANRTVVKCEQGGTIKDYQISSAPGSDFAWIEVIEATSPQQAVASARRVVDLYLNRLAVETGSGAVLDSRYKYQNLDIPVEVGEIAYVSSTGLGESSGISNPMIVGDKQNAAAYFRKGITSSDLYDSYRNFYLAIEAAGKQLRQKDKALQSRAEGTVVEDTIEDVFKKTAGENLQTFRARIAAEDVPDGFEDGKGHARKCVNEYVYQGNRCCLMHSGITADPKSNVEKEAFVPFDPKDELKVVRGMPLIRDLARRYVQRALQNPPV